MKQEDENLKITVNEGDVIDILLTREKTPIAYERKLYEYMDRCSATKEEAEKYLLKPIPMELFYSMDQGLFGVEAEAIESCEIFNPYSGKEIPNENLNH